MSETRPRKTETFTIAEVTVIVKWFFGLHKTIRIITNQKTQTNEFYLGVDNSLVHKWEYFPYSNLIGWSTREIEIREIDTETKEIVSRRKPYGGEE
jgi:hypothetical protein